jgi:DNA repair exonuclease SbcCD ATPase subunit
MADFVAEKVDAVNLWLAKLAARFRVAAGPDVDFVAEFGDGSPPVPADRLSGGEKAVLAWAWAAATAATRLLCLDEPTYGLDAPRLDALRAAVDGWRAAAPGCQLVLVTHDRRLADRCDVVLDLGAPT